MPFRLLVQSVVDLSPQPLRIEMLLFSRGTKASPFITHCKKPTAIVPSRRIGFFSFLNPSKPSHCYSILQLSLHQFIPQSLTMRSIPSKQVFNAWLNHKSRDTAEHASIPLVLKKMKQFSILEHILYAFQNWTR